MKRFEGYVIVITGGGSGIGREISILMLTLGATVCLVDRDRELLGKPMPGEELAQGKVHRYHVDITKDRDVKVFAKRFLAQHDRVNALVHCAGAFYHGAWRSISMESLDRMYETNLRAPVLLTKIFLQALERTNGMIVFVNSSAGRTAKADTGAYSVTKFGLHAFADSLREEINPAGIRVASIYPGRTATPMQERVCMLEGGQYRPDRFLDARDVAQAVIDAMSLPWSAEVTDLFIRPMRKPE